MPEFIPLKCPSCGAKLDVYPDMERFSCAFCGTEVIAQRRGRTIALKAVTDAIGRVQKRTDRIALEMELLRLTTEVTALLLKAEELRVRSAELQRVEEDHSRIAAYGEWAFLVFLFLATMLGAGMIGAMSDMGSFTFFFALAVAVLSVRVVVVQTSGARLLRKKAESERLAAAEELGNTKKQIIALDARITELRQAIAR